jgi:HlyD family type I secretion membrane fusion protein
MENFAKLPKKEEIQKFFSNLKAFLFATSLEKSKYFLEVKKDLTKQVATPIKFAKGVIILTLLFFGLWGGFAPLDSAITAPGSIVLVNNRQIIQHDGGVIKSILVKDGDLVKVDQPLIELVSTQASATLNIILTQLRTSIALEKRLIAEETGSDKIDFNSNYLDLEDSEVKRILANQEQIFTLRKSLLMGKLESINKQIEQAQQKLQGERGQLKSIQSQLANAKANARDAEELFKKEIVNKLYLTQAQNEAQRFEGTEAQIKATVAMTEKSIIEGNIQLLNAKNDFMNRIEEEYKQNHLLLLEAEQKYLNAQENLSRTVIKAPVEGVISSMAYHTIGGLIAPGVKILEITPQNDDLVVDAFVSPNEASSLRLGIPVKIQLNPYKQRLVPRVDGEVIYLSPNTIVHEQAKQEFYLVKIKIDREIIEKLNTEVRLYPGMPVTVFIIRGTRTFLQYLLSPIVDSFHRAFKEA